MRPIEVPPDWSRLVRIVAEVTADDLAAWFTRDERAELSRIQRERSRAERAASRIAAKSLALEHLPGRDPHSVSFDKREAKPHVFIADTPAALSLSFSHTRGVGAAALGTAPVGLDLEYVRPIDPRSTKFFLTPRELETASHCLIEHHLLHFWCAKEAAFKLQSSQPTLLKVSMKLISESGEGLRFEFAEGSVETRCLGGGLLAALALGTGLHV